MLTWNVAWHWLFTGRLRFTGTNDPRHKEAAAAILDRLIITVPDNPYVIQARAILADQDNKLGAAEQGYRRALELKQDLPVSLNNLAMIVSARGDSKEALSLIQRALTLLPEEPGFHDTVAHVQLKLKHYPEALESFKTAAKLDPRNIDRRIKLAQAYDEAGQPQDLAPLLDEIEKMISDNPKTTDETQRDAVRQLRTKVPKTALR
jgi:predicted Zn-dependent protease